MTGRRLQQRRAAFFSLHPLCGECEKAGVTRPATELDHKVPLFMGGEDKWNNLQGLCIEHHAAKTLAERSQTTHAPRATQ